MFSGILNHNINIDNINNINLNMFADVPVRWYDAGKVFRQRHSPGLAARETLRKLREVATDEGLVEPLSDPFGNPYPAVE